MSTHRKQKHEVLFGRFLVFLTLFIVLVSGINACAPGSPPFSPPPVPIYPPGTDGAVMFGLSAQHTHVVPYEQVLNVSTVKRLVPVWISKRAGTFIASLMAVNGIVYVGSEDKNLYAYKTTGCGTEKQCQPLWYGSTGGMIDASAAVFSGKVYISSGDGKVYAYDSNTCKKLRSQSCLPIWFSVPTKYAITSSPTIANGVLYIGSLDNRLYTYDIKGCLSQKSPCTSLWHSQDLGSGCVANGMVYAATAEGHVYAFGLNHA